MKVEGAKAKPVILSLCQSTQYRPTLNATTMLGLSKTAYQAEIDAARETSDFLRFGPHHIARIYGEQPLSGPGTWNFMDYRPLEGFVFAVTPFNFTAIALNLPAAPALMGNTVLWKPASTAVYPGYFLMKLYEEAGLPQGVINFLPGPAGTVGDPALRDPALAGVHFTGSTATFKQIWKSVGENIRRYRTYPRIVGETGGKDFVFVHASADPQSVASNLIRGAFEYQGQKCSAASRAYVPDSLWPAIRDRLCEKLATVKVGDVADFSNFMGAVIDGKAFESISSFIEYAESASETRIVYGGHRDKSTGYFIGPTVVQTNDPHNRLMAEEIFGPVLTVYVYPENRFEETLRLCDGTSPYGLTGAIFARERDAVEKASRILRHAAGNFYINDKPTGAVVGQQPFGGARASGTNDKAGTPHHLMRWVSPRTVKKNFLSLPSFRYPFMEEP